MTWRLQQAVIDGDICTITYAKVVTSDEGDRTITQVVRHERGSFPDPTKLNIARTPGMGDADFRTARGERRQSDAAWKASIRREIAADLRDLNADEAAPAVSVDITDQVR